MRKQVLLSATYMFMFLALVSCGLVKEEQETEQNENKYVYFAMAEDDIHPQLIAHAGGAIYGYTLSNSLEAINAAYEEGFRYIELDFESTSDDDIVLIHDWESMAKRMLGSEGQRTKEEFLKANSFADLTLLDESQLLTWMEVHPDCYVITDMKGNHNVEMMARLWEDAGNMQQNFIPQAYSLEEYDGLKAVGFPNVILTLYRMEIDCGQLAAFVREKAPWAITVSTDRVSQELIAALGDAAIYCHSVNRVYEFEKWHDAGITGVYTDYLKPSHWIY